MRNATLIGLDSSNIDFSSFEKPVHRDLLRPLKSLKSAAKSEGIELCIASGFRDFERQLSIWNRKVLGELPVLDSLGQALDISSLDEKELAFAILRWSALPGASRHHWGSDIDVYDASALAEGKSLALTVEETTEGGPFFSMHRWLDRYMQEEGVDFYRPYSADLGGVAPEPWHLSYSPLARKYEQELQPAVLASVLTDSQLLLKNTVIENLEEIFERFVMCVSPAGEGE